MKLASFLFVASLILFLGCGSDAKTEYIQGKLDSLTTVSNTTIDSLTAVIGQQEKEIAALRSEVGTLRDSLNEVTGNANQENGKPDPRLRTEPRGDPTNDSPKTKDRKVN